MTTPFLEGKVIDQGIAEAPKRYEIIALLIPWSFGWTATVNVPLARMLF